MTLFLIPAPQTRGGLPNLHRNRVIRRFVAGWSGRSAPDPVEARIAQVIGNYPALRRGG